MRKITLALAAMGLLAAACGGGTPATPGAGDGEAACDPPPVRDSGTLTVGAEFPYYEPFMIGAQEDPTGFEGDLMDALAEKLGLGSSTWVNIAFDQLYAPGTKQFDVGVSQITITEERSQAVDFSEPYFEANQGFLVRTDSQYADATSIEDLKDAKFGVEAGTTGREFVQQQIQPTQALSEFDTTDVTAQALKTGTIDVQVIDVPIAIGIRDQSTDVELQVIGQAETGEEYGLAMEKDTPLKPCVDQAITELKADGTLERLQNEYFPGSVDLPDFTA
jgi:polar amino acid transport system substrate-binding protein